MQDTEETLFRLFNHHLHGNAEGDDGEDAQDSQHDKDDPACQPFRERVELHGLFNLLVNRQEPTSVEHILHMSVHLGDKALKIILTLMLIEIDQQTKTL